jgi:hypothetical protein
MKNDLHKTFGQIFDNDITAFRNQLIDVQHHQANRKDAEKWLQQLRFLDISNVPELHTKPGVPGRSHLGPQYTGIACPIYRSQHERMTVTRSRTLRFHGNGRRIQTPYMATKSRSTITRLRDRTQYHTRASFTTYTWNASSCLRKAS